MRSSNFRGARWVAAALLLPLAFPYSAVAAAAARQDTAQDQDGRTASALPSLPDRARPRMARHSRVQRSRVRRRQAIKSGQQAGRYWQRRLLRNQRHRGIETGWGGDCTGEAKAPAGSLYPGGDHCGRCHCSGCGGWTFRREPEQTVGQWSVVGLSVLSCQFSVLSSQFSVLSSQFSVLSSQFSVLSSQLSVVSSQFSVLSSQLSVVSSQFSVVQLSVVSCQCKF